MPQGPPELHEKWKDDGNALKYLTQFGIEPTRGGILIVPLKHELTVEQRSALDYLVLEWDYDWEKEKFFG
jgi:hypothetical protein